ncbi:MAG: SET domain-containing protein [Betaproteobacteria bacterium]
MTRRATPPPRPSGLHFTLRVGASRIDGQGAFALGPIPARRKVGELTGERISVRTARRRARDTARVAIVELDERIALDASRGGNALRYVNHSCTPNCYLRIAAGHVEFYALRPIAPGEEITARYGATHHDGRLRCRCGSAGCDGWL